MSCSTEPERRLVCESCGETFSCFAGSGSCWCSTMDLTDPIRAELQTKYKECLCPACLTRLKESSSR